MECFGFRRAKFNECLISCTCLWFVWRRCYILVTGRFVHHPRADFTSYLFLLRALCYPFAIPTHSLCRGVVLLELANLSPHFHAPWLGLDLTYYMLFSGQRVCHIAFWGADAINLTSFENGNAGLKITEAPSFSQNNDSFGNDITKAAYKDLQVNQKRAVIKPAVVSLQNILMVAASRHLSGTRGQMNQRTLFRCFNEEISAGMVICKLEPSDNTESSIPSVFAAKVLGIS